jgi:hypothetical protein
VKAKHIVKMKPKYLLIVLQILKYSTNQSILLMQFFWKRVREISGKSIVDGVIVGGVKKLLFSIFLI